MTLTELIGQDIELTDDGGEVVRLRALSLASTGGCLYLLLAPVAEIEADGDDVEAWLMRCDGEDGGEVRLSHVEDEDEAERAFAAFDES